MDEPIYVKDPVSPRRTHAILPPPGPIELAVTWDQFYQIHQLANQLDDGKINENEWVQGVRDITGIPDLQHGKYTLIAR